MKKILATLLFVVSACSFAQIITVPIPGAPGLSIAIGTGVNALPLQNIKDNPNAVNITMEDDSWREVPLQFNFPYFGQQFNRSWMLSNGVVGFRDPATTGAWGMCCSGLNLTTLTDTRYNYSIMPLWTDLIAIQGGSHYYLSEPNKTTYGWYGVSEFYNANNRNSFEVDINSSGVINTRIGQALVTNHYVTSGMTGDLSKGEYYQYYHGYGLNIPSGAGISWSAPGGTGVDQCIINPLYNPSCPGYADAYKTQQCSINALYDPTCPGYQQAYFNQQCSLNSLYNESCPGYQQAYFTQQCTANPLYNSGCPGYATAYFNQQCSLSALYSPNCPGYQPAYFSFRCTQNPLYDSQCPGYGQAYFNQQCSINPLYNQNCTGYSQAFHAQQCSANPLYATDCPGYQQAYFNQQCSLNTLYSPQCPGYETAYQAYLRNQACQANPQSSPTCPGYVTPVASSSSTTTSNTTPTEVAVVTSSSGTVSTTPAVVADPVVNRAITTTSTSTAPTTPAAPVQLTSPSSSQQATTALVVESVQNSSTSSSNSSSSSSSGSNGSTGSSGSSSSSSSTTASSSSSGSSTTTQSPRQSLQQARVEAAKREAIAKGTEAVKESGEAKSMNAQVATQGLVIAAMGFNPSFDVYNSVIIKDASFYKPFTIYGGQKNVDNARVGRRLFGATDQLHNQMVQSQFELGK